VRPHPFLLTLAVAFGGCSTTEDPSALCRAGSEVAHSGDAAEAVSLLSTCLALPGLPEEERVDALQVRAWAYSNLGQYALAVADQEASYKLQAPTRYLQFINYAFYLRSAGRAQDSLHAVLAAEALEAGKVSMMTQYNKGWSLAELGRHREAVEAFTKGIPIQPDYAFVYWRRGLAYEGLGDRKAAQADFETSARLLTEKDNVAAAGQLLPAMREKMRAYGLDKRFPLEAAR
jgi:tetratricopeptide (TPR) repeat protein